jgi:predicted P-loop ATPase
MVDIGKQDIERVKSLLSRGTDRIRMAYGRLAEDYPRSCVMVGTLNPKGNNTYLQDETGNRRFWPISCTGRLDIDKFLAARDQLFAEAVHLYKNGDALWFDDRKEEDAKILGIAQELQEERVEVDPWVKAIEKYLLGSTEAKIFTYDIMKNCLGFNDDKISKFNASRVGGILRKLGYKPTRTFNEGRYFVEEEVDTIEFSD